MKEGFLFILLATLLPIAASGDDNEQCGMYIAISSTSTVDDTKWGLYAGKDFANNAPLGYPDIAVNLINLQGNAHLADDPDESGMLVAHTVEFFEQFIWVPIPSGGQFELEDGRTVTAIPGAGVLGGFNPKMTNADWNHSAAFFRPALGEQRGRAHPGRGAYTNFFNVQLRTKDEIQAGREIFLDVSFREGRGELSLPFLTWVSNLPLVESVSMEIIGKKRPKKKT